MDIQQEFRHQTETLLELDYPTLAGISKDAFFKQIHELEKELDRITQTSFSIDKGLLPFVIVVKHTLVPTEKAVSLTHWNGKQSFTNMYPHTPQEFTPIDAVSLPKSDMYLLIGIDRGKQTINIPPDQALQMILKQKHSPLTIDEGVAILTHYPEFLQKNNCFSLLASRVKGNQRVPALWITQEKNVRLGWCWERNPHTWLGSASAADRVG